MAFGIEFCMSKSSKSSKQRSSSQHQSNRKNSNVDLFQSTNTAANNNNLNSNSNSLNGNSNNRNSQHSLNHRDHHTTPTTTTTTTNTTPNTNLALVPQSELLDHNNQNLGSSVTDIRHVVADYYAVMEDELSVVRGDICLFEYSVEDDQGKSWSSVLCLTQNNARGFVPSEILSIEKPKYLAQYRKKSQRTFSDHQGNEHHHHHHHPQHNHHMSLNPLHHTQRHHHHIDGSRTHHHSHHHHGPHHTSGVAPTVISNAAAGLMGRVSQCEVNKIAQCISDKTCPSNGDSIRYQPMAHVEPHNHLVGPPPPSDHHAHHQSRLDIHHHANMLQGSSSGCQTFQKYPEPSFPVHHLNLASYYNLDSGPPPVETPYDRFRPPSECIPFRREEPGDLYVVLFNFVNREERDISVKPGDFVYVLNKNDIHWYWVRREEDNLEGFVPSRFIVPNDKAESVLNKGNSTVTMKSSNAIDCHTYINTGCSSR